MSPNLIPSAATKPAIDDAIFHLKRLVDLNGRGCPYELWIARANLTTLEVATRIDGALRDAFLETAAQAGLYDPDVAAGWTIEATNGCCIHGLDLGCCPAGCGSD